MSDDILEQLARLEVREPPPEFDHQLHERMNRSLLVQHVVELATGVAPWALGCFAQAVLGLVRYTITGRFDDRGRSEDRSGRP
jgi:hypothetical protein